MKTIHFIGLMVVILLLAALLRIEGLNDQGLWGDEGWSVEFSDDANPANVTKALVSDLHPPLYFIGLAIWREIAGDSEISMRMLAVFAALISIALVSRLAATKASGAMAALVLSIADKHIVLSQEVRHYPLAFMMMAWASWLFWRWLRQPSRRNTLLYSLIIILSLYIHYYTLLIVLVQFVYLMIYHRQRLLRWVSVMSLSGLAFLPWAMVAVYQLQIRPEGILHSMRLNWSTFEFLSIDNLGRPPLLLGSLVLIAIALAWRFGGKWAYAALWFLVPIAVTILVYPYVTVITDRNLALLLLPIALLAGHAMTQFQMPGRMFLATIILANGLASLDSFYQHPPWREMAEYVAENYPANEPVFMDVVGGDKALRYHLQQSLPEGTEIVSLNQVRIDFGDYFLGIWDQYLRQNDGFWIAYWVNEDKGWEDVVVPMENLGYTRTAAHRFYHLGNPIDLYHYDRLPAIDETLTIFDNTIRLHRVKYPSSAEEILDVSIWWSTNSSLSASYSVSVFLLDDAGRLQAQHDGPPQSGAVPTNTWSVDTVIFDSHRIDISTLAAGEYQLAIKIYDSDTGDILFAGNDESEYFIVDRVDIR